MTIKTITIIEDNDEKFTRYKEALEAAGARVERRIPSYGAALLAIYDEHPPTSEIFLVDGILDEEAYAGKLAANAVLARRGEVVPLPLLHGQHVVESIRHAQEDGRIPVESKVIGISAGIPIPGADIAHATPEQVLNFLTEPVAT